MARKVKEAFLEEEVLQLKFKKKNTFLKGHVQTPTKVKKIGNKSLRNEAELGDRCLPESKIVQLCVSWGHSQTGKRTCRV